MLSQTAVPGLEERLWIEAQCLRLSIAFAVNVDHRRYDTVARLFAPVAIYRSGSGTFIGPEGVLSYLSARPAARRSRHVLSNHLVDVVSDTEASGSCVFTYYASEASRASADVPLVAVGDYEDRYVLTTDGWRFSARLCTFVFGQPPQTGAAGK